MICVSACKFKLSVEIKPSKPASFRAYQELAMTSQVFCTVCNSWRCHQSEP